MVQSCPEASPMKWHQGHTTSRPSLDEVIAFRMHVDEAMEKLFAGRIHHDAARRILLGLNHEQQHQELMLTDIKHAFFSNPLRLAHYASPLTPGLDAAPEIRWHSFEDGVIEIGYGTDWANCLDFCFGSAHGWTMRALRSGRRGPIRDSGMHLHLPAFSNRTQVKMRAVNEASS
jgi:hypothetical protein